MYEMWKRTEIHEDARNMYRTKILVKKFGEMVKTPSGSHDLVRRMETGGGINVVQKVLGIREGKNGTKASELL